MKTDNQKSTGSGSGGRNICVCVGFLEGVSKFIKLVCKSRWTHTIALFSKI